MKYNFTILNSILLFSMTYIPLYLKTNACAKTLKLLNIAYTIKLMFTYFSTNTYSLHIRSISSPFKPFFMHNSNLKLMFALEVILTKKSYANFSWGLPIFSFQWVFHGSDRYAYFCIWKEYHKCQPLHEGTIQINLIRKS